MDGSIKDVIWWYAVGSTKLHNSKIPGPSYVVDKVELYVFKACDNSCLTC